MLGSHSQLAFPPETGFFRRYVTRRVLERASRRGGLQSVSDLLSGDHRIARLALNIENLLEPFRGAEGRLSDASVYDRLLRSWSASVGKPRAGDKDPRLIELLPLVHRYWPEASVVHVIRDPRDVLASKKTAAWSKHRPSVLHIFVNRYQMGLGRLWGAALFGGRYVEVVYERLIRDPRTELAKVCEALGLRYEPGLLDFAKTASDLVSDEERSWKGETLGPLLSDNAGKWERALTDWEAALTELACAQAMEVGGYTRSTRLKTMPALRRASVWLAYWALSAAEACYRRIRVGRA
jgi:hypothetical protein